jgi:hypothetical protein
VSELVIHFACPLGVLGQQYRLPYAYQLISKTNKKAQLEPFLQKAIELWSSSVTCLTVCRGASMIPKVYMISNISFESTSGTGWTPTCSSQSFRVPIHHAP